MARTTRRSFLQSAAGVAAALGLAMRPAAAQTSGDALRDDPLWPFLHGVASGDPIPDSVVLWTRVTEVPVDDPSGGAGSGVDSGDVDVDWVIATDLGFTDVVARGTVTTTVARDYTVHVDPGGLAPDTTYFYAFAALGRASVVGRTRTAPLPTSTVDRFRIGTATCANYKNGFFNVYRVLAEADLDLILHMGDYIYESDARGNVDRPMFPEVELVELDEYRQRYGQYRRDPDLQRCHQVHPWLVIWDDHETVNDTWRDGSPDHDPETQGDFRQRIDNGVQAWREWIPSRAPDPSDPMRIWRRHRWGTLLEIFSLDTRLERDEQPRGDDIPLIGEPGDAMGIFVPEATADDRIMISLAQREWLHAGLATAQADGVQWKILHNQTMLAPWYLGGIPVLPDELGDLMTTIGVRNGGNSLNGDQWDGYQAERNRLIDAIEAADVSDVVVITGDIHPTFAADVTRDPFNPAIYDSTGFNPLLPNPAVEFLTPAVTNRGFVDEVVPGGEPLAPLVTAGVLAGNPHIRFFEGEDTATWVMDITADAFHGDHLRVTNTTVHGSESTFVSAWGTDAGASRMEQRTGPLAERSDLPASPPETTPATVAPAPSPSPTTTPAPVSLPSTGAGGVLAAVLALGAAAVLRRR